MNEMTTTKGRRRRFSAEDRGRWVELYERSGEGVREFCCENALCQSSRTRCASRACRGGCGRSALRVLKNRGEDLSLK